MVVQWNSNSYPEIQNLLKQTLCISRAVSASSLVQKHSLLLYSDLTLNVVGVGKGGSYQTQKLINIQGIKHPNWLAAATDKEGGGGTS